MFVSYCDDCTVKFNDKKTKKSDFDPCKRCQIKEANGEKCYDHCHLTGCYRSSACSHCNMNVIRDSAGAYRLPVLFHNLEGYDGHIMVKAILNSGNKLTQGRSGTKKSA